MHRLRTADLALLVTVMVFWASCFLLHLNQAARGELAWIPLNVVSGSSPASNPSVLRFWSDQIEDETTGLRIGDEVVAVGEETLVGAGQLELVTRVYEQVRQSSVPLTFSRDGVLLKTELQLQPIAGIWRRSVISAAFALLGALSFWRMRGSRIGRLFLLATVSYALHWAYFWGGSSGQTVTAIVVFGITTALSTPFLLRFILAFPEETARSDRWSTLWPWAFATSGLLITTWAFGVPLSPALGQPLAAALNIAVIVVVITIVTRSYRASGQTGRRQIKWLVLGTYLGLVPPLLSGLLMLAEPGLWWLYEASLACVIAIPICLVIAMLRYNMFDIDRLLTVATTYTLSSFVLLAGLFIAIPRAVSILSPWVEANLSQPILALMLAAILLMSQKRGGRMLEARLFPERRVLENSARRLRADLGRCDKPSELLTLLGERLVDLLRLDCVVIYAHANRVYAPVFIKARIVNPAFSEDDPLIAHLETVGSLEGSSAGRRFPASRGAREALIAMGVELILPLGDSEPMAAFACLGEKQSGDVFTATDRALLSSVADKVTDELRRFGRAALQQQEREVAMRLRSYVPGAIADRITEGAELSPGERDVTVLFVDLRGFMNFSERQAPDAIFRAINEYTRAVSGIVREHGGAVTEFHGDGLMAVFGAPDSLQEKERAAVKAARIIVSRIPELPVRDGTGQPRLLQVGIGIASGAAYVGNVEAVDRSIWVALGNTTNLASRLESLTRDLDASIAVDDSTRLAAGSECAGFVRHIAQAVKGRSDPINVHALPLISAAEHQRLGDSRE